MNSWLKLILSYKFCIGFIVCLCILLLCSCIGLFGIPAHFDITAPFSETSWKTRVIENGTVDSLRSIYLFNWTNYDDFLNNSATPNFVEVGPFVFKEDIEIFPSYFYKNAVDYTRRRRWIFLDNQSISLDTTATNFNAILGMELEKVRNITSPLHHRVFDFFIQKKVHFTVTQTARDLLFDGFIDESFLNMKIMPILPPAFGWFLNKNNTEEYLRMNSTGEFWKNKDGEFEVSTLNIDDQVIFKFEPKFHRLVTLRVSKSKTNKIGSYYTGCDECLNSCLDRTTKCITEYLPFTLSLPHFLDRRVPPQVTGLRAIPELHRTSIVRNEIYGLNIETNMTYQVNIKLAPLPWSETYLKHIKPIEIPMMWFKDTSHLSNQYRNDILNFSKGRSVEIGLETTIIVVAPLIAIICFLGYWKHKYRSDRGEELLDDYE